MKNNTIVCTAIFGDKDYLKDPIEKSKKCDYVCFTDNPNLKSKVFDIKVVSPKYEDPNRSAKIYKILPHRFFPDYKYSIWIDGNVIIKTKDVKKMITKYLKNANIAVFKHPQRSCIFDELETCIKLKKDDIGIMRKQIDKYKNDGYPSKNGLAACTVIMRRHNSPEVINFGEDWWREIKEGSKRDQLSFNYVAWKHKFKYGIIDGILWENDYFKREKHKK